MYGTNRWYATTEHLIFYNAIYYLVFQFKNVILSKFGDSCTRSFIQVSLHLDATCQKFIFHSVPVGLFSVWLSISIDLFTLKLFSSSFRTWLGEFHGVCTAFISRKIFRFILWLFCWWHLVTFSLFVDSCTSLKRKLV